MEILLIGLFNVQQPYLGKKEVFRNRLKEK